MQAIILAGGKGTRLGQLTKEIPKPMVLIGGIPIIEHQIKLLKRYGITDVIITLGHLHEKIRNHLKDGEDLGVSIDYFLEENPLGTAGAIPLLQDRLKSKFLVLYGDVMMDVDLKRLIDFHDEKRAEITLVVHPNDHPYDSDLVEIDSDKKILNFLPKPHKENSIYKNLVNAGLYLFNKSVIDYISKGENLDFGKDIFPSIAKQQNLYAYNTPEYLKDMGTPDRLLAVREDYDSGKIQLRNLSFPQKAIFLDRDGVLNEDKHLIHRKEDLILYDFTHNAIKKINRSNYLSIVVTNQSVVARNLCTIDELENIHNKLDTDLGNHGAKLDALYYCPYHPDKGYPEENPEYKREHPWRKPNPGMLLQAADDFNINLKESYIIGDRKSDIEAGENAGVKTIGVMTGDGLKTAKSNPDFMFSNVEKAVDFIIENPIEHILEEVISRHKESNYSPLVISIGGQSQSGKSTLSSYLKIKLTDSGYTTRIIKLDNWLLPQESRNIASNVFERFDCIKLNEDVKKLLNGEKINLQSYNKVDSIPSEDLEYVLGAEDILIFEGVVSLAVDSIVENAHLSYYTKLDSEQYKEQFYKLYQWKGYDNPQIDDLFKKRLKDEFELIEETMQKADKVISIL